MRLTFFAIICFVISLSTAAQTSLQLSYEKARSAYQKEQYEEAIIYIKNVLQQDIDNLPAQILMAQALTKIAEYEAASSYFKKILRSGADISVFIDTWATVQTQLKHYQEIIDFKIPLSLSESQVIDWQKVKINACLKLENYECAKQSYLMLSTLTNNPLEQINGLANVAFLQEDYVGARNYLAQALEISDNNVTTLHLLAMVNKVEGRYEEALTQLFKAKSVASEDNLNLLKTLAEIYLAKNDTDNASLVIEQILDLSPQEPFAILVNSQLVGPQSEKSKKAMEQLKQLAEQVYLLPDEMIDEEPMLVLLRGLISFQQDKFEQALRDFQVLRKQKPKDLQVVMLLARTQLALSKNKEAVKLMEQYQTALLQYPGFLVLLGEQYLNTGKTFRALTLFNELVRFHPEHLDVRLLEIKILLEREQFDSGLSKLDTLIEQSPSNKLLFIHAVLNLQAKRFDVALKSIDRLLTLHSNNLEYLTTKSAILIQQQRFDEAKRIVQQVLKDNGELVGARFNLASIHYQQNNIEQAIVELERLHKKNPLHSPTLNLLAQIDVKLADHNKAMERYLTVLTLDPENISALEGIYSVHLSQNNIKEAITTLNTLLSFAIAEPKYLLQRAYLHLALGDERSSEIDVKMLETIAKDEPILLLALSELHLTRKEPRAAEKNLRRILELQPDSRKVNHQLIELLLNNNKTEQAQVLIEQQLVSRPDSASLFILAGRMYEQKGEVSEAAKAYIQALSIDDSVELGLAKLYHLTRFGLDKKIFLQQVQAIIERHPERYFPINLLAQYYYYEQEWSDAAEQYKRLLSFPENPNRPALLNRLATMYLHDDISKSESYIKQAIQLDNTDPYIQKTLGMVLVEKKQYNEAIGYLRKAFVKIPNDFELRFFIAQSLVELGLIDEAKEELEFLISQTNNEFVGEARTLLQAISGK
jgi:putative PEP-CTERM system TPR-repeat lipoprotein